MAFIWQTNQRTLFAFVAGMLFLSNCAYFDTYSKKSSRANDSTKKHLSNIFLGEHLDKASVKVDRFIQKIKWNLDKAALRFLAENDLAYGEKLYNARKYKDAEFYLSKGLVVYPENLRALKHRAWSQFFQQRFDLSLGSFKKIYGFYPKDPDSIIGLAWSNFGIKQYKKALEFLKSAKHLGGNAYEIAKGSGFSYLALHNNEKARDEFSKIFSSMQVAEVFTLWKSWNPSNSRIPIVPTDAHSPTVFQLPIEEPRHRSALMAQANLVPMGLVDQAWGFYHKGKVKKALQAFEGLRKVNYPDAANGLAWTLLAQDRFLDAEAIFSDILKTHPGFPGANLGLKKAEQLKQEKAIYGQYYFDLQKNTMAIGHYEKLAARYPGWAFPHKQMGLIHLSLKNYDSAYNNFQLALLFDHEDSDSLEGMKTVYKNKAPLLHRANQERDRQNFKPASQLYMDFLTSPPQEFGSPEILAEAYNGLGWSYFGKKQYVLAISKFKEALKHPKFEYEAATGLGKIYHMYENYEKAAKYLAIAHNTRPEEKDLAYKLDWSTLQSTGIKESEKSFQKILKKYPLRASAYMALGWIYYQKNKPDLAVEYFLKAISLDPDFALTEEFSKILDEERFGWQVYNQFGWEYFHRKRYNKSIYLFQVAMGRHSNGSETFKGLGYNFYKKADYRKAIQFFKQCIALNRTPRPIEEWVEGENAITPFPLQTDVRSKLGWSYYHLNQYNRALEEFQQALEKHPEWSTIYDGLGWTYFKIYRLLEAQAAFQKAIDYQPLNNSAHKGLKAVKQAQADHRFNQQTASLSQKPRKKRFRAKKTRLNR